ncbi:MAG: flagellar motor protein MotB [Deltaproteobacteria bacterium]|nr:flagellar motor protein MotB [Deltaproteobacteria bacterium]
MAREKKEESSGAGMGWLVTFADLMTLLLTFFVLLLSMATMDRSIMREIAVSLVGDEGLAPSKGAGKVPAKFEFIEQTLQDQEKIFENHQRLKDTLFPDEVLPKDMPRNALLNNLEVLARPEGVAIVLSEGLLFQSGQSELNESSKKLLSEFVAFLASYPVPVNIAGYTDNVPGGAKDNYVLSAERAMAVLTFFLEQGFEPERFSVSAYGPDFPLAENNSPEGRAKNRRVEILLKTTGRTYL